MTSREYEVLGLTQFSKQLNHSMVDVSITGRVLLLLDQWFKIYKARNKLRVDMFHREAHKKVVLEGSK